MFYTKDSTEDNWTVAANEQNYQTTTKVVNDCANQHYPSHNTINTSQPLHSHFLLLANNVVNTKIISSRDQLGRDKKMAAKNNYIEQTPQTADLSKILCCGKTKSHFHFNTEDIGRNMILQPRNQ